MFSTHSKNKGIKSIVSNTYSELVLFYYIFFFLQKLSMIKIVRLNIVHVQIDRLPMTKDENNEPKPVAERLLLIVARIVNESESCAPSGLGEVRFFKRDKKRITTTKI